MNHFDPKDENQHFFASCMFGWATAKDPATVMKKLVDNFGNQEKPLYGLLFHVPLHPMEAYSINFFQPQVQGITKIYEGEFE